MALLQRPSAGPISSGYGYRKLAGEPTTLHSGIDFVGALGSPIRAAKAGRVIVAAPNGTYNRYGNLVVIQHDDPSGAPFSLYAHLNSINVRKGAHVRAGRIIGTMGNLAATADDPSKRVQTHLHFELLKRFPSPPDVDRVDPTPFLLPTPVPQPYYPTPLLYSARAPLLFSPPAPYALSGVAEPASLLTVAAVFAAPAALLWFLSRP